LASKVGDQHMSALGPRLSVPKVRDPKAQVIIHPLVEDCDVNET